MTTRDSAVHSGEPVEVYVAANEMEAQVIRSFLESNGIPVMLQGEAASKVYGFAVGGMAEVRVYVPEPLASQAVELLEAGDDAPDEEETGEVDASVDPEA